MSKKFVDPENIKEFSKILEDILKLEKELVEKLAFFKDHQDKQARIDKIYTDLLSIRPLIVSPSDRDRYEELANYIQNAKHIANNISNGFSHRKAEASLHDVLLFLEKLNEDLPLLEHHPTLDNSLISIHEATAAKLVTLVRLQAEQSANVNPNERILQNYNVNRQNQPIYGTNNYGYSNIQLPTDYNGIRSNVNNMTPDEEYRMSLLLTQKQQQQQQNISSYNSPEYRSPGEGMFAERNSGSSKEYEIRNSNGDVTGVGYSADNTRERCIDENGNSLIYKETSYDSGVVREATADDLENIVNQFETQVSTPYIEKSLELNCKVTKGNESTTNGVSSILKGIFGNRGR